MESHSSKQNANYISSEKAERINEQRNQSTSDKKPIGKQLSQAESELNNSRKSDKK